MLPKSPQKKRRGAPHADIVPTALPVFDELQRRGLVVVMGERAPKAKAEPPAPRRRPKGSR